MEKTALICGVGGQDGSYLARLLLSQQYDVIGTTRHSPDVPIGNLVKLGI